MDLTADLALKTVATLLVTIPEATKTDAFNQPLPQCWGGASKILVPTENFLWCPDNCQKKNRQIWHRLAKLSGSSDRQNVRSYPVMYLLLAGLHRYQPLVKLSRSFISHSFIHFFSVMAVVKRN